MGVSALTLMQWGITREHDPAVNDIQVRLGKVWRPLSDDDRSIILSSAEAIAQAEAAKAAWNPKADEDRQRKLRLATHAAELAKEIRSMYPPPWVGHDRELLVHLSGFVEGTLRATKPVEKETSAYVAAETLRRAARRLIARTGRAHLGLMADLACLASGMLYPISERSVRRYLETPLPRMDSEKKAAQKRKKR